MSIVAPRGKGANPNRRLSADNRLTVAPLSVRDPTMSRGSIRGAGFLACLAFLLVVSVPVSLRAADTWDAAGVDAILADTLRFWKVPGMAVAIVRDDKVVY